MARHKIIPGVGFDDIKFGMMQDEVEGILGEPDEVEEQNYGDGEAAEVFYYDELGISMSFDAEEDYRLVEISFEDENFILFDSIHVGQPLNEVLSLCERAKMGEYDLEDLSLDGFDGKELYTYEKDNINLWIDDKMLSSIQIGPYWLDDDTIKWP
jgi:hypothetical protein